jgi:hypothetical protein
MFIVVQKDIFSHLRYLIGSVWKKHSYDTADAAEAARNELADRDDFMVMELKEN